jgi:hypothetical protein
LDYVTAEKGASASADDFKSMTNGLAQALNGQFGSLTRLGFVLDDATKKQIASGTEMERAEALTRVLNSTYKDFNANLRDTSQGAMQVAINDFNNLKQEIGESLQPAIDKFAKFLTDTLIPAVQKLIKFLKENKDTIVAVTKVLLAGAAAYAAYRAAIVITTAATTIYQVAITLLRGQQLATIASTNGLAASMLKLNAVMRANPIGVFITIATTAVAIIVALWKNSETFRNVVITAGKAALNAFAAIIPMVAQAYEAILKVVTGPLRLLLTALSKLPGVGKYAKAGLDLMNKGLDGISDLGTKAAAKAKELSAKLDGLAKSAEKAGKKTKEAVGDGGFGKGRTDKGGVDEKTQKKIDSLKEKLKGYYEDWAKAQETANERFADAQDRYNERVADSYEAFEERKADLQERYQEQMADAQERYNESVADADKRRRKAEETAQKKFTETLLAIEVEYGKRKEDLAKTTNGKIADLEKAAQQKREDIIKAGQDKLADIVQKGRQRLRDAWAKGTEFSLTDLFGGARESGKSLVETLQNQLNNVKTFQKEAGALAGEGYTQTFIEQIVAAGPEAGMEMIKELKKLSPQQQKEVQSMYMSLETITESGMNSIADTLSTSTSFATSELANMYFETQQEIANALTDVNTNLQDAVAEAKAAYEEALAEASKIRDEKLAEANEALTQALAEAKTTYDEALADAMETLTKAQQEAKKTLDKGLADAQKELNKALEDAMKAFQKTVDEINRDMQKKLDELLAKIAAVKAALASLGGGGGGGGTGPNYIPKTIKNPNLQGVPNPTTLTTNNVTITGVNLTNPNDTANSVINMIKFGNIIVPTAPTTLASGESGLIGAANIASRMTIDPSYVASRAR